MPRSGSKKSGYLNIPAKLLLKNKDNATGSYPSVLRMGDKDRSGNYSLQFDDANTIVFGRRIFDKFELKEKDKVNGVLGYTKSIDTNFWTFTSNLEIRKESFLNSDGSTASDGALVLIGAGDAEGRWISTKEKIKNPVVEAEVIYGPYNETRSILLEGLGLKSPGVLASRGLKIQISTSGSPGSWSTIKTLTGDLETLFAASSYSSKSDFQKSVNKRKRIKIKLTPADFSVAGANDFYLRFIQENVVSPSQPEWAIGYVDIKYHNEEINYPLGIDASSRIGQKIATGAIANTHSLPTLKTFGRATSGLSDVHLSFTPGESITAYEDSRINTISEDLFFRQGSAPETLPNFSTPLWSKTQIIVDLSPNTQTTFGLTSKCSIENPGDSSVSQSNRGTFNEPDNTIKQQLMVYWNKDLKCWEKIAQGVSGNAAASVDDSSLFDMISSGALGFSSIGMVSTGSDHLIENQVIVSSDALSSYVRPTSTFGFPYAGKYEATSSQVIKARDIGINKPFLLEKCSLQFDSAFEFASINYDSGSRAYSLVAGVSDVNPSGRTNLDNQKVFIPTFFILRQHHDNFIKEITYYTGSTVIEEFKKSITIPDSVHLSTDNSDSSLTTVENARELITYGQVTLFVSGTKNQASSTTEGYGTQNAQINLDEVLSKGLSRDLTIDVLSLNGQTSFDSSTSGQLASITGSFTVNFPSRVSNVLPVGSQVILKLNSGNVGGLYLNNAAGGRSYGSLESSSRAIVNGTPTLQLGDKYNYYSPNGSSLPVEIQSNTAQTNDLYSPFIILPEDDLVFGWQYPMTDKILRAAPGKSDNRLNSMSLFGNSKLVLYGSQLREGKEFYEGLNQNLLSDNLHEIIGSEPVTDQFEISRAMEYEGGFLDNYVTSLSNNPIIRVGSEVQSRLTTAKNLSGRASATISITPLGFFLGGKKGGMNDGLRISLTDHLGSNAHFYGFRHEPAMPKNGASPPVLPNSIDTNDNGTTDISRTTGSIGWSSPFFEDLNLLQLDYGSGTNYITGVKFTAFLGAVEYPVDGSSIGYKKPDGFIPGDDEYFSFKIDGGDNLGSSNFTNSEAFNTLLYLMLAINASSLDVTCILSTSGFGTGLKYTLTITQNASGTAGNTPVVFKDAIELYSGLQDDYRFSISSAFAGGNDSPESSLSSFSRIYPLQDGTRVYVDSKLKSTDIGFPNSNFGTMQTEGSPIRPKYYLSTKKYGQLVNLLEQGRDGKTTQDVIVTPGARLLDTLTGGSLESPVNTIFVTGSISGNGVSFSRSNPVDSVNKTINSVLTGAFYDRP